MLKMRRVACMLVGAAAMYFLDPKLGKRRRAVARDKLRSRVAHQRRRRHRHSAFEHGRRRGEMFARAGAGEFHQRDNRSVAEHLHAVLERTQLHRVPLHADDRMALVRETGRGDRSDMACADDRDPHHA